MMKKLVIISHTEHQQTADGSFVGWGPTVNEINYLSNHWEEVVHVACLEKGVAEKGSSVGYTNSNIQFESIPTFGGKRIWKKLDILWKMPLIIWKVQKSIKGASHVQLRLPMGIGIFLIPFFAFRNKSNYIFWVKYANNWGSDQVPLGYRLQRWLLKKNKLSCKVTINGFWPNQPKHCLSFENPCLTDLQLNEGEQIIKLKMFGKPYQLVFVGRIDSSKGVDLLIDFIEKMNNSAIGFFHVIGEGDLKSEFEKVLNIKGITNKFYGNLTQVELFELLKKSHCVILPSKSEGFPKVLAEAMNFGCIPITSNVGSIGHYIKNEKNGFVFDDLSITSILDVWYKFDILEHKPKKMMINNYTEFCRFFTFDHYYNHLNQEILK